MAAVCTASVYDDNDTDDAADRPGYPITSRWRPSNLKAVTR